jgi:hypothetical protein
MQIKDLFKNHREKEKSFLHAIELILALAVIIAVAVSFINQIPVFLNADWGLDTTFINFIKIILHLAVGVELARLLVSYNINTVIELLVFVIARKILLFDESAISLVFLVLATVLLFAGRYFFTTYKLKNNINNNSN